MYVIRTLESRTVAEGNNPGRLNTRMCDVGQKKRRNWGTNRFSGWGKQGDGWGNQGELIYHIIISDITTYTYTNDFIIKLN